MDLKELGLTEYESSVYLALVKHGVLSAKEISTYSNVPSNRVYETAINLQRYGFVNVILGKPKRFEALKPNAAIDQWISKKSNEITLMKKDSRDLINFLTDNAFKISSPRTDIMVVRGELETINKRNELFQLASNDLKLIVSAKRSPQRKAESQTKGILRKIFSKIKVNIISSPSKETKDIIEFSQNQGAERRFYTMPFHFKLGIIDSKLVFIESNEGKPEEWYLLWTNSKPIVWLFENYFEKLWEVADKKVSQWI